MPAFVDLQGARSQCYYGSGYAGVYFGINSAYFYILSGIISKLSLNIQICILLVNTLLSYGMLGMFIPKSHMERIGSGGAINIVMLNTLV